MQIRYTAAFFFFISFLLQLENAFAQKPDYGDSTITIAASDKYKAQFFGRIFLGNHYRKVWSAPVTINYLDLEKKEGGLTPLRRGGGFQTLSLRLAAPDSSEYVIRTIDKDPSKTVSSAFQNTIVTDLIQDQISASHPYAFLVVAPLAKAANIYHTNPQVLYVPDDPKLGAFRNDFKNRMVLFEERTLTSANVEQGLAGFTKVKNTFEVYDALHKSADNFVDQKLLLRSRLFDMMIGDWDRHEDQWLWAQFNLPEGKKMFRPIPRDRDQAFFNFDGILPTFASLNVAATRKMQRYRPMPLSVKWFNFNGRNVDHNLLSGMTHEDWRDMADSMLITITDADIEKAFKALPDTVYKLSAPELIKTLKSRRDNLPLIADSYYKFLAKNVTITGTNKPDYFEVKRTSPNITDISVYQYKNGVKGALYYHRAFNSAETKRLQLYGLGANDVFNVEGKSSSGPLVRIIGGDGNDTINDQSKVGGFGKKTQYYDMKEGNVLNLGKECRNKTSNDSIFNSYNYKSFDYNSNMFFPVFGYSPDDGIFLGAAVTRITYGFKKGPCPAGEPCFNSAPYATKQSLNFDVALKDGSFNFNYKGDFTDVIGKLDLNVQARVQAPNYHYNFFGFGDTTEIVYPKESYRLRINQVLLFPALEAGDENKIRFLFGPIYQQANVLEKADSTFLSSFPDLTQDNLSRKHYLGANTQFTYDPFKQDSMAKFQVRFLINTGYLKQIEDNTVNTAFVRGYISLFYNFYSRKTKTPVLTFATRFGGGYNSGEFEFYQSNIIGGRTNQNVRGYLGERFAGRSALYNNFEIRARLFHFNAYIFPADFGIIGLVDNGKVWYDNQDNGPWHTGYGGGIWLSPFSLAVISATYSFSNDQDYGLLNLKLGWWF